MKKAKRIKVPRIVDLGYNNKAKVLCTENARYLISYETIIAIARIEKAKGVRKMRFYRFCDELSNTSLRHWNGFAHWMSRHDLMSDQAFYNLPLAEQVGCFYE